MNQQPWRRLWNFILHYRTDITTIYFFAVLGGLLQLSLPIGIQAVVSLSLGAAWATSIYLLIALVVLGVFLVGLLQLNQMRLIERLQQTIFTDNAVSYSKIIPQLDLLSYNNHYLPEQVNRFFESFQIQKMVSKVLLDIPTASIQIIFGLILLGIYHPAFILFGLGLLLAVALIIRLTVNPGLTSSMEESNLKYVNTAWIVEMARVVMSLKISKSSFLGLKRTDRNVTEYLAKRNKHFRVLLIQYKSLVVFKVLITAAMLTIAAILLIDQKITIGEFIAAEIVILTVINSIEKLIGSMDNIYDITTGLEKMENILDAPAEKNGSFPYTPNGSGPVINLVDFGFSYPSGLKVFENLNIRFAPNTINLLSGKLGHGKSTLLRLLSTQYHHYTGQLLFDGISLQAYDLNSIRAKTGVFIHQKELFQGTVRENISMGNAEIKDEDIIHLMKELSFDNLINDFSKGLDQLIDPAGNRLASNKVNKLLLMRALINRPSLLVLDEPFLHLSAEEKRKVVKHIEEMSKNTTVIIATDDDTLEFGHSETIELR